MAAGADCVTKPAATPVGILITVALLGLCSGYALWLAVTGRSLLFASAAAVAAVACVAAARLLAWSRYLVYLLTAVFIGLWAYSVYDAAQVGYFSLYSPRQIAMQLAPGGLLIVLSCFCSYAVFRHFRLSPKRP